MTLLGANKRDMPIEDLVFEFMKQFVPGGVTELIYSTDIVPKASLLRKLHFFYHPYNPEFHLKRYMTFDEDDYIEQNPKMLDLRNLE